MNNNFYDILWVSKSATQDEIKKAYRKKAMQYHPDRNKWDKASESKFKEINEAYETLWDEKKRKNYDTFWSSWFSWWNPFWWGWYSNAWFSDLEDLFWNFSWWNRASYSSAWFDFWDIFWNFSWNTSRKTQTKTEKKEDEVDLNKTYEVPLFDLILGCKIEVEWFLGQKAKLKIPENTKPGTKFRVKDFWKSIWGKTWNLIVTIDVRMPKHISDIDKSLLNNIRDNITY